MAEGWLNGSEETDGSLLGCKLGTPVVVGLMLGWLDGAAEMEGFSDGIDDGWAARVCSNGCLYELGDYK